MAGLGARALVLLPLLTGAPGCFAELVTLAGGFEGEHCLKMVEPVLSFSIYLVLQLLTVMKSMTM